MSRSHLQIAGVAGLSTRCDALQSQHAAAQARLTHLIGMVRRAEACFYEQLTGNTYTSARRVASFMDMPLARKAWQGLTSCLSSPYLSGFCVPVTASFGAAGRSNSITKRRHLFIDHLLVATANHINELSINELVREALEFLIRNVFTRRAGDLARPQDRELGR